MQRKTVKGAFALDDLERVLTTEMRSVFLDVVLRWASVDGAVSQLFASVHALDDLQYADAINGKPTDWKLREIQKTVRSQAPELARTIGKLKKQYGEYSNLRNTIAHCHCAGRMKSDPDRAIFLRYSTKDAGGLIVDAIHIENFEIAIKFGEHLRRVVERIDNDIRGAAQSETPRQ